MKNISYNSTFVRSEIKYLLTNEQYQQILTALDDYTVSDEYGITDIHTIYYDTPDYLLIRNSLEKPVFKEKLRLRTYGHPEKCSTAFVEIKRKYNKIVYKRRFPMPYSQALTFFQNPSGNTQIAKEIDYTLHHYTNIQPAMEITYNRISRIGRDDSSLRITFDSDIYWSTPSAELNRTAKRVPLLQTGSRIMEIKTSQSIPLWLSQLLTRFSCYPGSFSKYGAAYTAMIKDQSTGIIKV